MRFVRIVFLSAGLLAIAGQSIAQATTYGQSRNPINCGILLVPSTSNVNSPGGTDADPYVFYNMGKRTDLLPGGWDFLNPFAPTVTTQRIYDRWKAIMNTAPYQIGDKIQRSMAPYWEVNLADLTDKQLAMYDILLIHAPGPIRFNPEDRERLRRFVDGGGILWYDKATNQSVDSSSGFPLAFSVTSAGSNQQVVNPTHPLLNYPHKLTFAEATSLGIHPGGHAILPYTAGNLAQKVDYDRLTPVVVNSAGGVVMEADYGTGHFVVTACNISSAINEPTGGITGRYGSNSGPFAGSNFLNIPTASLKFAYNLMGLVGTHRMQAKGSRRLNATFEDLGAPLLTRWSAPVSSQTSSNFHGRLYKTPVVFKGLLIVADDTTVYAYDLTPGQDLDGDGNPDDGFQDYFGGTTYDLVWKKTIPGAGRLSTPLAIEVPVTLPNFERGIAPPNNQIWVMDDHDNVWILNAYPSNNGKLSDSQGSNDVFEIQRPDFVTELALPANSQPNPLAYSDGMVFATGRQAPQSGDGGVCWVMSPKVARNVQTGTESPFYARGGTQKFVVRPFSTGPTVGMVPQNIDGGGSDQMVYAGYEPRAGIGQGNPCGFAALWFRSRGEKLRFERYDPNTQTSYFKSQASGRNLKVYEYTGTEADFYELNPRFYIYDQYGNPVNNTTGSSSAFAAGQFEFKGNLSILNIYCDYTINWADGAQTPSGNMDAIARTIISFPDSSSNPKQEVIKSMALAPNGNLFIITSELQITNDPYSGGGSLFCFKEQLNNTKLLYRWQLHNGYTQAMGSQTFTIPPTLIDNDDLVKKTYLASFLDKPMTKVHFHGTPTIHDNICYIVVSARKPFPFGGDLPVTAVLAFDADPEPAEIRLGGPIVGNVSEVEISQPDPASSLDRTKPTAYQKLTFQAGMNNLDVDAEQGIIRITNFLSTQNPKAARAISVSQPVVVKLPGQPQIQIDPNVTGTHWSPLKWFMTFNGFTNESPCMVTGGTLYLAGGWAIESFVCRPMAIPPQYRAVVIAMDSQIPTNDEFLINDPLVPNNTHSNRQLMTIKYVSATQIKWNTHTRWPSGKGISNLEDYCTRVRQAAVSNRQMALGVVGGDGTVIAWDDRTTMVFERALTAVADQGRIVEFDSEGFVTWNSENTYAGTLASNQIFMKVVKLTDPTKVYKLGSNEYLIADTGANRIVRIERTGFETRSIESFNYDVGLLKNDVLRGFNPGDPLTLRQPRDVQTWTDYVPAAVNPFQYAEDPDLKPQPWEYWVHYLIADTGNARIIEVVDRHVAAFDNKTGSFVVGGIINAKTIGDLVYHSPLNAVGRKFRYQGVSRVITAPDAQGLNTWFNVAIIGNWEATRTTTGDDPFNNDVTLQAYSGAGAIIIERFEKGLTLANKIKVVNRVTLPGVGVREIVNPQSVQAFPYVYGGQLQLGILIADQNGVAFLVSEATDLKSWKVIWQYTDADNRYLRGIPLNATSARRLGNGNILLTNSFVGQSVIGQDTAGEVLEIRFSDYNPSKPYDGFDNIRGSVRAELPPIVGTRPLRLPLFADR